MKVQIHHNEVRPLIKEGYDKVYDAMSHLLSPEEMIFAKWEAGFGGILQWTLPGDYAWRCFTQGDTYDKQAVVNEFSRLKGICWGKLGSANERLKQNVFSFPSDSSIYFAVTPEGKYLVKLTAWGYSFPMQAPLTEIEWKLPPECQDTTVRFIENNSALANLPINIHRNGIILHHKLDEKGEKYLGKILPGESLNIEIPSHGRNVTLNVVPGQTVYTFDLTVASTTPTGIVTPVKRVEEEKPSEPDPTPEPERNIRIQFIGCDGRPIGNRGVNIAQREGYGFRMATDPSGFIYLTDKDLVAGKTLKLHIEDAPQQTKYTDCEMVVEDKEDEYAIVYSEKKRSWWWVYLLLILAAIALAYIVIVFAINVDL